MRRLIWKELREKRVWLLVMVLWVFAVTALRGQYTFLGVHNLDPAQWLPSAIVALLYGLTAFSSEIGWGTSDFLFSRPVSWKKVLGVKLGVALGTMLVAAIVGIGTMMLWVPDTHSDMLASHRLEGIGLAMLLMGLPYLFGLAASVVFPGFLGSTIVLVAAAGSGAALIGLLWQIGQTDALPSSFLVYPIASVVAVVLVTRFGLTLSTAQRAQRFALVMALGAVAAVVLTPVLPRLSEPPWMQWISYHFSPDGSHVLVTYLSDYDAGSQIIRLSDGNCRRLLKTQAPWNYYWTNGLGYTVKEFRIADPRIEVPRWIVTARMEPSGRVRETRFMPLRTRAHFLPPSPDGRYLPLIHSYGLMGSKNTIRFVDVPNERTLDLVIEDASAYWWQDDSTFGWIDANEERHLMKMN